MPLLDPNHPFFTPRWRRWATILVPCLWGLFEFRNGSPEWGVVFEAAAAYSLWALILQPAARR
jgi:hypothetical protein